MLQKDACSSYSGTFDAGHGQPEVTTLVWGGASTVTHDSRKSINAAPTQHSKTHRVQPATVRSRVYLRVLVTRQLDCAAITWPGCPLLGSDCVKCRTSTPRAPMAAGDALGSHRITTDARAPASALASQRHWWLSDCQARKRPSSHASPAVMDCGGADSLTRRSTHFPTAAATDFESSEPPTQSRCRTVTTQLQAEARLQCGAAVTTASSLRSPLSKCARGKGG